MKIATKRAKLISSYENTIFFSEHTKKDRLNTFYKLLKPILSWIQDELILCGLEREEAESEVFLLCNDLFSRFNRDSGKLIPYLSKFIPLLAANKIRDTKRLYRQEFVDITDIQKIYYLQEEYYWRTPNILFEDRYIGKCFTRDQKYLIYIVLMSDKIELSINKLSNICGFDKRQITKMLRQLANIIGPIGGNIWTG